MYLCYKHSHAPLVRCFESLGNSANLLHRAIDATELLKDRVVWLLLGNSHVCTLQTLREDIHDLWGDIHDVRILNVDLLKDSVEPVETLVYVGIEAGSDSG